MSNDPSKRTRETGNQLYADFDNYDENDFDQSDLARDVYSTEWGDDFEDDEKFSARRKIERRMEEEQLRSELKEWEEFGLGDDDNY